MDDKNIDISGLSTEDRQEIEQFLQETNKQINVNRLVHTLVDTCWKKCITSTIKSEKLDSKESACATNCVQRWLDTQAAVMKTVAEQAAKGRSNPGP